MDPPIRDAGIKGRSSYPMGTGLGLGYSFAQELLASGGVDGPIGLVPCAYGGSPLSRWERAHGLTDEWVGNAINIVGNGDEAVDGDLYAHAIRHARLALERGNTATPGCALCGNSGAPRAGRATSSLVPVSPINLVSPSVGDTVRY